MNIKVFSKYYQLSLENKVLPILCSIDENDGILVPNLDEHDRVYLYCLGCNFKMWPGQELYNNIEFILEELELNE